MDAMEHMDIASFMDDCIGDVTNGIFKFQTMHSSRYAELSAQADVLNPGLEQIARTFDDRYQDYEAALCARERTVVRYYWSSGVCAAFSGESIQAAMAQIVWRECDRSLPDQAALNAEQRQVHAALASLYKVVSRRERRLLAQYQVIDEAMAENMAHYAMLHGYEWALVLLEAAGMERSGREGVEAVYKELP